MIKSLTLKRVLAVFFIFVCSLFCAAIIGEVYIRTFPPKGIFSSSVYNDEVGLLLRPGSRLLYNNARKTVSTVNNDGFLDINHSPVRQDTFRVGFFGDSYVEAMQVPLEQRFFRILPEEILGRKMEYFGFGISGFGTLDSYLNYMKQTAKYDIDLVVYVFVENDPGDNLMEVKKNDMRPAAVLRDAHPGFSIDYTYRKYDSVLFDGIRRLKGSSRLIDFLIQRIYLLKTQGIKLRIEEKERRMETRAVMRAPNQNDLPSSWSVASRNYAEKTAFHILAEWVRETKKAGKQFAVLYVPREGYYLATDNPGDIWKTWLMKSCWELGIDFIDPSHEFVVREKSGVRIYDDHWTREGHESVAKVLTGWLSGRIGPHHH